MLQTYKQIYYIQIDIAYNNVIEVKYTSDSVPADPLAYQSIPIGFHS